MSTLFLLLAFSSLPARAQEERRLIVIDPGHGGHDWGAVAGSFREKDICLAVARKLKRRLQESGASAHLTRDSDVFLRLDQRVGLSLGGEDALFISLHVDKVRGARKEGMQIYTFGGRQRLHARGRRSRRRGLLPQLPAPSAARSKESARLAADMTRLLRAEGFRVEGQNRARYYVLKNPEHPSVLIEMGYLSNPREAALLGDDAYQERLASALARALSETYARLPAPPEPESIVASR